MKLFKQSKKFLTKENIEFIEGTVLEPHFPFFFNYTKPHTKELKYLFTLIDEKKLTVKTFKKPH